MNLANKKSVNYWIIRFRERAAQARQRGRVCVSSCWRQRQTCVQQQQQPRQRKNVLKLFTMTHITRSREHKKWFICLSKTQLILLLLLLFFFLTVFFRSFSADATFHLFSVSQIQKLSERRKQKFANARLIQVFECQTLKIWHLPQKLLFMLFLHSSISKSFASRRIIPTKETLF